MIERIKLFLNTKRKEIIKDSNKSLKLLDTNWDGFLKKETYLISDDKHQFNLILKKGLKESKVPFYLFWDFKFKKLLKENYEKLKITKDNMDNYNSIFINQRLKNYKSFFDGKDDNLKYPLDNEQRFSIVKDDKHNLVIAAAGSGKTSVITSKIAYLIRRKDKINPKKILALAFTRVAAEEMQNRIRKDYKLDVNISTFHQLGRKIIKEKTKQNPKLLFDGDNANQKFNKIIKDIFNKTLNDNSNFQELIIDYLSYFLDEEIEETSFEEKEEYYEYMRNKKYTTLTNVEVKSIGERDVANFLFKHGIEFEYEPNVEWSDNKNKEYQPDFYLPKYDIYIEHWGLNENNQVPHWFRKENESIEDASKKYLDIMQWKLDQFKKHNKLLVQVWSYEKNSGKLIENLKKRIIDINKSIKFNPLKYEDLIEKTYQFKENANEISSLISSFIGLAKSNFLKIEDIHKRINSNKYTKKQTLFGKIAVEIQIKYQTLLEKEKKIDFNDMINKAIEIVNENKSKYLNRYDYVLIDEFQDISNQRMELIKCFVNKYSNTKLFCVGDDWQSIYQFTGSEVKFFVDFNKFFPNPEVTHLKTNYRCSKLIVNMSNKLISHNKYQIEKQVQPHKSEINKKVEFYELIDNYNYSDQRQKHHVFKKIKELIQSGEKPEDIMVISRFNKCIIDLKILCGSKGIRCEDSRKKTKGVRFYTAHKSKGSQAKHVFLLDIISGIYGFPCEIEDSSVLE